MAAFGIDRHDLVDRAASRWRAQRRHASRTHDPGNPPRRHARHVVSVSVIARSVIIQTLGRGGLGTCNTRDTKRGKPKQECDRLFQGTLLMNGNILAARAEP
jgi:hypothetical protein